MGLLLILAMAFSSPSLLMVKPASAQTPTPAPSAIPTPSVPVFSIAIINSSYNVPPTYSTDPYTGQTVTNAGYSVDVINVTLTIRNQPLVFSNNDFVYDIQIKPHYSTTWADLFDFPEGDLAPSSGQSTAVTFQFNSEVTNGLIPTSLGLGWGDVEMDVPLGGKVDFQVRAGVGHGIHNVSQIGWEFNGELSGWSPIQTVTIGQTSTSASPSPASTSTPSVPELSWLVIVPLLLSVFSVAVMIRHRKQKLQLKCSKYA